VSRRWLLLLRKDASGLHSLLTNRWVASIIPAAIGIYLAWSHNFLVVWASFGAANQLIAAIALMTGATFVAKKLKSPFANVAVIPAWLLWITVTCGLVWFMAVVLPGSIAAKPVSGWTVMIIVGVLLILNMVFIVDFVKSYKKE